MIFQWRFGFLSFYFILFIYLFLSFFGRGAMENLPKSSTKYRINMFIFSVYVSLDGSLDKVFFYINIRVYIFWSSF